MVEHTAIGATERFFGRSLLDAAKQEAQRLMEAQPVAIEADPPPPPNVTFGTDWVSTEETLMLINQGGHSGIGSATGDICCLPESPQCQVQLSHRKGTRYFDLTHSRTRYEDVLSGEISIDDYHLHKSYAVTVDGGVETCKEYCPIDVNDTMRPYSPFSPFDPIKDLGATTFEGHPAEHYQWKEQILHIITMSQTDLYADITDPMHAVPLFMTENLEPLGRHMGYTNRTWTNWTSATPPASKFSVQGLDTCPMAKKCNSQQAMLRNLQSRQFHTFASSMLAPM